MTILDAVNRTARRPLDALDDLGGQLLFYVRAHRLDAAHRAPLPQGGPAAARRGQLRHRRARRHRRHGRRDHLPGLLHRHRGRAAGLPGAQPARHRRVHRLHLGLLQHPRDRAAGRRPGAGRHGRLRLHRPARRDADLRGDRRARGDGRAEPAVPGDHPDDRRLRRRHPAVRDRPALVVLSRRGSSPPRTTGSRRAPTTTTSTCSCRPATCSGRSSRCWSSRS